MRNDKERQAFVQDDNNWHRVGMEIMGRVRLRELEYKNHTWYRIEVMTRWFDYKSHAREWRWQPLRMYVIDKATGAFADTVSVTQIVNEIKEIDKEERKNKNND